MKKFYAFCFGISLLIAGVQLVQCKSMAKAAAKYWTKKQIKEFKAKCKDGALNNKLIKNADDFCDCATSGIAEKYKNYEDAKAMGIVQMIKEAKDCLSN